MLTADELKTLREILDNDAGLDDGSKEMIMGIAERNEVEGFKFLTLLLYMLQKYPLQTSDQQETSA